MRLSWAGSARHMKNKLQHIVHDCLWRGPRRRKAPSQRTQNRLPAAAHRAAGNLAHSLHDSCCTNLLHEPGRLEGLLFLTLVNKAFQ